MHPGNIAQSLRKAPVGPGRGMPLGELQADAPDGFARALCSTLVYKFILVPQCRYRIDPVQEMKKPTAALNPTRKRSAAGTREFTDADVALEVRPVRRADLDRVIDLDATVTGLVRNLCFLGCNMT